MFEKFVMDAMADYTFKLRNQKDYQQQVSNKEDKDINKVLLFTKKDKVAPVLKSVSAEFKDRLRFSII